MTENRVEVLINLSSIKHNYKHLKNIVGSDCKVMPVVKADAYGHGAARVSAALVEAGADFFAVASLEEAMELRKSGVESDILIFGVTCVEYMPLLNEYNLIQTAVSVEYAELLSKNGGGRVHIKIDTGMSRLGLYCHSQEDIKDAVESIEKIQNYKSINIEGIFTHFADSDKPSTNFTEKQFSIFSELLNAAKSKNIKLGLRHCCNSAAILNFPHMKLDMVRAGISLYGLTPLPHTRDKSLRVAMTLKCRISAVAMLKKGDSISYGRTFTAQKDIKVAVLSIGYADGLFRSFSDKAFVKINDKKAKIIGTICMDLCVAEVSDIHCRPGDEAIIFETADDINTLADILGTINYEIICSPNHRVKRLYTDE